LEEVVATLKYVPFGSQGWQWDAHSTLVLVTSGRGKRIEYSKWPPGDPVSTGQTVIEITGG
jgi:hypothetical protein